jgi:hypothetical protein
MSNGRAEVQIGPVRFADLVLFTSRSEQFDPQGVRRSCVRNERLRYGFERCGGSAFIGDGALAEGAAPRPTSSRGRRWRSIGE